jgi:hypothetical protein
MPASGPFVAQRDYQARSSPTLAHSIDCAFGVGKHGKVRCAYLNDDGRQVVFRAAVVAPLFHVRADLIDRSATDEQIAQLTV